MCIALCILEAMFHIVFHQIRIIASQRIARKAFKADTEMVKTEQKKNHGTHRWWSDSTTMVSASRSCHQPMETLQLKDLHHIKGLTNTETEVHDIYMPNKARTSIPQLRRVPSHKLEITAWQTFHMQTAHKSINQLKRVSSHKLEINFGQVFHRHGDERPCKLYDGAVKRGTLHMGCPITTIHATHITIFSQKHRKLSMCISLWYSWGTYRASQEVH